MVSFIHQSSCILVGIPMWYLTRYKRSLTNRDGFAIVTFSWILTAIVGALPFYLSGAIPNLQMHSLNQCQELLQLEHQF